MQGPLNVKFHYVIYSTLTDIFDTLHRLSISKSGFEIYIFKIKP